MKTFARRPRDLPFSGSLPCPVAAASLYRLHMLVACASGLAGLLVASAAGMQSDRFRSKEHPLDWGRLNASRGFCGMAKCYFPARLSEQEVAREIDWGHS